MGWKRLERALSVVGGNGRWAVYTALGLLNYVMGWELSAPDMMMDGSTGPLDGLRLLFPMAPEPHGPHDVEELDRLGRELCRWLHAPADMVETTLCDLWTLANGRYYVGHDIDIMLGQTGTGPLRDEMYSARRAVIPHAYLGELHDWTGVDPMRRKAFRDTGQLVTR